MGKFNFKFERLLDYKKTVEDYKKGQYGKAKQKLIQEEDILENYYNVKDDLKKKKNKLSNEINVANLQLYNNYLTDMNRMISTQEQIIDETKNKLKVARNELLEATKEKKMFEKLKENKHQEYLYSIKKEEEKLIDTIVSFKANTR